MRKILSICLFLFSIPSLHAQLVDSNFINLGRTQLRKDFVQGVTIHAKDLEKLPFTSLSEVINVWLDGSYSHSNNLVYVVDGVLLADPNIYSIHDIEDITMVENAEVQLNGAFKQRMMVVIRTKRASKENLDFSVWGQSHAVQLRSAEGSELNFFHQYGVSAFAKTKSINGGASFSYLQDVLPHEKNEGFVRNTPTNLDRFRLNSFIDVSIDPDNLLTAKLNLVTQPSESVYAMNFMPPGGGSSQTTVDFNLSNKLVHAEVGYQARFGHFTNNFVAGYQGLTVDSANQSVYSTPPANPITNQYESRSRTNNLLLQNTFTFSAKKTAWEFLATLNASYRRADLEGTEHSSSFQPPNFFTEGSSSFNMQSKKFLLTPSLDLSYGRAANIHAGVVADLSKNKEKTAYPFISATADLLQLFAKGSLNSLKIFGSYATAGYFADEQYRLTDFDYPPAIKIPAFSFGVPTITNSDPDNDYSNLQAGSVLNLSGPRLSLSYNYEHRDYFTYLIAPVPIGGGGGGYTIAFLQAIANTHRAFVQWKAIDKSTTTWYTGLHATSIKNHVDYNMQYVTSHDMNGDVNEESRSWTGGWNNRLELRNFSFGGDIAYHFGRHDQNLAGYHTYNLFAIQCIYAGYKTTLGNNCPLEIYLSTRNTMMNDAYVTFNDNRQYFGAGFKLQF